MSVTGRVISAAGQPVPGAEVVIQPSGGAVLTTVTDATGRFEFAAVEPDEYRLTARSIGLSPAVQRVTLSAKGSLDITLVLPEIVRERVDVVGDSTLVEKIPGSAHVIDRREMEKVKLATDDIHQMLRRIPGVNIQEEEGYGFIWREPIEDSG